MRILQAIDSLRVGGAESVLFSLIQEFARSYSDIETEVVVLYELGSFGAQLRAAGTPIICLNSPRIPGPRHLGRLTQVLRHHDYDVVHTHLFPADYAVGMLSLLGLSGSAALVHTEHSEWNRRREIFLGRLFDGIIYSRFSQIIGVSSGVCRSFSRWLPGLESRVRLIPNGVKVEAHANGFVYRINSPPQILFVGSLRKVKGLDILLRALASMKETDYNLYVLGDGPLRDELQTLSHTLGIAQKVQFMGIRSDVSAFMKQADCLVVTSRWEGLPMVALESMAAGCPVVATPVGGIPDLIEEQVTGWLVPPEDPETLAETLTSILRDPKKRFQVAEAALARVRQHYSIEKVAAQLVALYKDDLGR